MATINTLHRGVNRVRRFRFVARVGSGLSVFLTLVVWALLLVFFLDLFLNTDTFERVLLLGVVVIAALWSLRKHVLPALAQSESRVSMAAMVERQQGIPSDLVATMQFADKKRNQYGSEELRAAIVTQTVEVSGRLNYLEGFSRPDLWKRFGGAVVSVLLVGLLLVWQGEYAQIFFKRMLFNEISYPTATKIADIVSPGNKSVYGKPILFRIQAGGVIPEDGEITIETKGGTLSRIELVPEEPGSTMFVGQLDMAIDDINYTVALGDAVSEKQQLQIIPVPIVEMELDVNIPKYARHRFHEASANSRSRVVLEGTTIKPRIVSSKSLSSATLAVNDQAVEVEAKDNDKNWGLVLPKEGNIFADANANPFADLQETIHYRVEVKDLDGIELERPIGGVIQVRPDLPPRIAAATVIDLALPSAKPRIKYRAVDDYAIGGLSARILIERDGEELQTETISIPLGGEEEVLMDIDSNAQVDLSNFSLEIGDSVTVTLIVRDYRGDTEGEATEADPLILEIASRSDFLAAMRKVDAQTDEKLDQIIQAQLGIGDRK